MPNPNPVKRTRRAPDGAPILPPGFSPAKGGLIRYRYTERGERQTVYGRTVEACLAKRYAPPPPPPTPEGLTLAAYLRLWVAGLDNHRESTAANYRAAVEHRLIPLFGETVGLAELDRETIKARFAELRESRVRGGALIAPRTVSIAYAVLRKALYDATTSTPPRIAANPAARINPNGATGKRGRSARVGVELPIPTELEVRRLIVASRSDPWGALIPLAAMTGLRQGEALALTSDSIDFAGGWLTVAGSVSRETRAIDDPKNGQARLVPFHPALGPILEAQALERDRLALVAGDAWANPEGRLWAQGDGSPLIGSTVSHWFARKCAEANVPHYRYHDLRHYYASTLLNRGVSPAVVSKYLGHRDLTVTSRIYHHVTRHDELGVAELAGAALAGALG